MTKACEGASSHEGVSTAPVPFFSIPQHSQLLQLLRGGRADRSSLVKTRRFVALANDLSGLRKILILFNVDM